MRPPGTIPSRWRDSLAMAAGELPRAGAAVRSDAWCLLRIPPRVAGHRAARLLPTLTGSLAHGCGDCFQEAVRHPQSPLLGTAEEALEGTFGQSRPRIVAKTSNRFCLHRNRPVSSHDANTPGTHVPCRRRPPCAFLDRSLLKLQCRSGPPYAFGDPLSDRNRDRIADHSPTRIPLRVAARHLRPPGRKALQRFRKPAGSGRVPPRRGTALPAAMECPMRSRP